MATIREKIQSLSKEEKKMFDLLAVEGLKESEFIPFLIGVKLIKLGLLVEEGGGNLSMPSAVHTEWCDLCTEYYEENPGECEKDKQELKTK